jgi:hypothetical protein
MLLILAGLSLPFALLVVDSQCPGPVRPAESQEPGLLPDGEVTTERLLAALRDDPGSAMRHWSGRPVRVIASADVDIGRADSLGPYFVNHVGLLVPAGGERFQRFTVVFRPADEKEFGFLRLGPGSTMVVEGGLGDFDGRVLTLKGVRLVRR